MINYVLVQLMTSISAFVAYKLCPLSLSSVKINKMSKNEVKWEASIYC